ncbi:hypothetical protein, partial [Pontibacter sp. H249]|uniref:hypothetical protein n=1 Tax=Pontibacter sp. H249 TaxID=3133420 RepID=UPI0030BF596A
KVLTSPLRVRKPFLPLHPGSAGTGLERKGEGEAKGAARGLEAVLPDPAAEKKSEKKSPPGLRVQKLFLPLHPGSERGAKRESEAKGPGEKD